MKKAASFFFLILGVVGWSAQAPPPRGGGHEGFGPGFGMMSFGPGSRTPVTGAPYSAVQTTQSQQTLADGNQLTRQEQSKVYRDSQGRVRIEHTPNATATASGKTPQTTIAIFDPVAGFSYVLNPATMTAIKMAEPPHHGPPSGTGHGGPPHDGHKGGNATRQTEDLGTQVINGVSATGKRTTETIPAGAIGNQQAIQIVHETWISTDLKVPVEIKSSDPRFGNTSMQLTNIVRAEPDPSLFQVPPGYTIKERTAGGHRNGMRGPGGPHD